MNGIKNYLEEFHKREDGAALITVLLVLIILSTLAMGYMLSSSSQQMLSRNRIDDTITFLASDAGIAYAMTNLAYNTSWETRHLRNDPDPSGGYYMREDGFLLEPYKVWDEETIPLPNGSYAYVRTWVEYETAADSDTEQYDQFILSLASYGTAQKIIEAEYYFPLEIFNFAYFGRKAIHLDNHKTNAMVSVQSSAWTNGEFEIDDRMIVAPADEEDFIAAGGHVQIAGTFYGDIFCPSLDTYGPDGEGFNSSADCATLSFNCWGIVYGNVYLTDGYFRNSSYDPSLTSEPRFLFRDPNCTEPRTLTASEETSYAVDGGTDPGVCTAHVAPMSYGAYASVATTNVGQRPGQGCTAVSDPANAYYRPGDQTCVVACSEDSPPAGSSCTKIEDDTGTTATEGIVLSYSGQGSLYHSESPFDPNDRPRYAYRLPNRGGKVLLYRDFPELNWQYLYDSAKSTKTVLPSTIYNRGYYISGERSSIIWADEASWYDPAYLDDTGAYTESYNIGGTPYVSIGDYDASEGEYQPLIWYIGDGPTYDENDDLELSSVKDLEDDANVTAASRPLWKFDGSYDYGGALGASVRGVIVHGTVVMEGRMNAPEDAGCHIYGCGYYDFYDADTDGSFDTGEKYGHDPSQWAASDYDQPADTGSFPDDLITWMNGYNFYPGLPSDVYDTNPHNNPQIPYNLPAIICGSDSGANFNQDTNAAIYYESRQSGWNTSPKTQFMFIHGAVFTYGQSNIETPQDSDSVAEGTGTPVHYETRSINNTYFMFGSQVAEVIHNNRYLVFEYDDCVKSAIGGLFTSSNRDLVEVLNWRTVPQVEGIVSSH